MERKLCCLRRPVNRRVRSGVAEKGQQIDQLLLERRLGGLRPVGRRGVPFVLDDPLVVGLLLTEFGLSGLVNRLETVQESSIRVCQAAWSARGRFSPFDRGASIGLNAVAWRYECVIRGQSGLTLASTGHCAIEG